jgi:hypothetical protein
MPDDRENAAEMKQVARLDTFNISTDRSWGGTSAHCQVPQAGAPHSSASDCLRSPFA